MAEAEDMEKRKIIPCEVCSSNPAKYRCPGCEQRTCSVVCVRRHKEKTSCSGKRDVTAYVPMKCFSDNNLLSDYRFLEDVGRKSQGCHRDQLKRRHDRPKALMKMVNHAKSQGIEMRTMPYPMSKRKNNRTFFLYRTKEILWQIEWAFQGADIKFIDKKQTEKTTLVTLLDGFLSPTSSNPIRQHKLREFVLAGSENCHLLMKVEGTTGRGDRYHELDVSKTILENLQGKCVIEYPTILVVLPKHTTNYTILTKEEETKVWQDRRREAFHQNSHNHHPQSQWSSAKDDDSNRNRDTSNGDDQQIDTNIQVMDKKTEEMEDQHDEVAMVTVQS